MIIVDLNQVLFSNLFASLGKHTNIAIEESLLRHMALNTLRSINVKFRNIYGNMVIANDNSKYWRKEFFPYYKAARKKSRENSDLDWNAVFQCLDNIKAELKEIFPYKFIDVPGAEADDIIATLSEHYSEDNILIISGDKDFQQLQKYTNVQQYDPVNKRWIKCSKPEEFLYEHIIHGDRGDGIPNVLTEDNAFVLNIRQKRLTKRKLSELSHIDSDSLHYRNFIRNKTLIDFDCIPKNLKTDIINQFENTEKKQKEANVLMNYFIKNKLKNLMENINDF